MRLLRKTGLIVGATSLVFTVVLVAAFNHIVMEGFTTFEDDQMRTNVMRVLAILGKEGSDLQATAADYAFWDDTAQFVVGEYEDYPDVNFADESLENIRLSLVAIVDPYGTVLFRKSRNIDPDTAELIVQAVEGSGSLSPLTIPYDPSTRLAGVFAESDVPVVVAGAPILDSRGDGPVRGVLLFGRVLDESELERMQDDTQLPFEVHRFAADDGLPELTAIKARLEVDGPPWMETMSAGTIVGYSLVPDILDNPGFIVRLELERVIHRKGMETVRYLLLSLLGGGILMVLTILALLHRQVLSRLAGLTRVSEQLRADGTAAERMPATGNDEVGALGQALNRMLDGLQDLSVSVRREREVAVAASRAKTEFLASMSHELRTPLNHILGFAQLIKDPRIGSLNNIQMEYLDDVLVSSRRLLFLIDSLLDLTRMEAGPSAMRSASASPSRLIADVLPLFDEQIHERRIVFDIDLSGLPLELTLDERYLKQAMFHVLASALQHEGAGGRVRIEGSATAAADGREMATVSVSYRGTSVVTDWSRLTEYSGEGDPTKGLIIARRLVELQGGTLTIKPSESGSPGSVVVHLPKDDYPADGGSPIVRQGG